MTDKDVLELAAKANWTDDECSFRFDEAENAIVYIHADNQDHNGIDQEFIWNPLEDDGDALRLAVKLNFTIDIVPWGTSAQPWDEASDISSDRCARHNEFDDPCAATRRAIVRAAADIGRNIEVKEGR